MDESKLRYLIPNGITFASLGCGIIAIMLSMDGYLQAAGILIICSYILDMFDGAVARQINASSEFGLQLDSLVDMVSLGTAPAALAFAHLRSTALNPAWIWPFVVLLPLAGAFRLARFNLLPPKTTSSNDSVGLTISTGGATLALAVLADVYRPGIYVTPWIYILMIFVISVLMVSKVSFPPVTWVFSNRLRIGLLVVLFALTIYLIPFFNAWFVWTVVYVAVSLIRAFYKEFIKNDATAQI